MHSRNKTLGYRFLITGRAVYLPRAIKACHAAYKHAASECPRIDMIIFDSIARHDDFCLLEPFNDPDKFQLYFSGQCSADPIRIDVMIVKRSEERRVGKEW